MIEQILETVMEILERLWVKVNLLLDLKHSELFQVIKPYILDAVKDPLVLGISLLALIGVPYGLYKIRKINASREEKLDRLIEEMEERDDESPEEVDEEDAHPLFPGEANRRPVTAEEVETDMEESDISILERLSEESEMEAVQEEDEEDAALVESQEPSVESYEAEEEKDEVDQALKELMGDEYDLAETRSPAPAAYEDDEQDQAILDLQAEMEETIEQLTRQLGGEQEEVEHEASALETDSEDDDDLRQEKAINDLNSEMEETINRLTRQIESSSEESDFIPKSASAASQEEAQDTLEVFEEDEIPGLDDVEITMKDLEAELELLSYDPEIPELPLEEEPALEEEPSAEEAPAPELTLEEESPALELTLEEEETPEIVEPLLEEAIPELAVEQETFAEPELKTEPVEKAGTVSFKAPKSREIPKAIPSGKVEHLIGRLENLQEHLASRFNSMESFTGETGLHYQQNSRPRTEKIEYKKRVIRDEDYMSAIESFIFMAGQKKRK